MQGFGGVRWPRLSCMTCCKDKALLEPCSSWRHKLKKEPPHLKASLSTTQQPNKKSVLMPFFWIEVSGLESFRRKKIRKSLENFDEAWHLFVPVKRHHQGLMSFMSNIWSSCGFPSAEAIPMVFGNGHRFTNPPFLHGAYCFISV